MIAKPPKQNEVILRLICLCGVYGSIDVLFLPVLDFKSVFLTRGLYSKIMNKTSKRGDPEMLKVLVVDESLFMRTSISGILNRNGFSVIGNADIFLKLDEANIKYLKIQCL